MTPLTASIADHLAEKGRYHALAQLNATLISATLREVYRRLDSRAVHIAAYALQQRCVIVGPPRGMQ